MKRIHKIIIISILAIGIAYCYYQIYVKLLLPAIQ